MIRAERSYENAKMFAVIFLIIIVSLVLVGLISVLERRLLPWKYLKEEE